MDVRITTRHAELSNGFLERAEERTRKLTKFEPRLIAVDLLFDDDHGTFTTEARADVPGRPPLIASAEDMEPRKALDAALDKLARQLRRERKKRVDHQATPAPLRAEE
jgi:ribosomal subunit interface protein